MQNIVALLSSRKDIETNAQDVDGQARNSAKKEGACWT